MKTSTLSMAMLCFAMILSTQILSQGTNVALNKFADQYATGDGNVASNAVNGDFEDQAQGPVGQHNGVWWQVDLGKIYDISRVVVHRYAKDEYPRRYDDAWIVLSNDETFGGHSYFHQYRLTNGDFFTVRNVGNPMTVRTNNTAARYVRFWADHHHRLGEIEVYGIESEVNEEIAEEESKAKSAAATKKALQSGDSQKIKALVEAGELDMSNDAVHKMCIDAKDSEILVAALKKNKNVSDQTMQYAFGNYNKKVINTLIKNGNVDLNRDMTSAVIAQNDLATLKEITRKDKSAVGPEHVEMAMNSGQTEMADFLMTSGISGGAKGLDAAIQSGNEAMVRTMIENGTSPTASNLNAAISAHQPSIVSLILAKQVRPNSETFVLLAQQNDAMLYDELTIEHRIPNNRSIEIAIDNNNKEILSSGLSAGGNVNQALTYALSRNNKMAIDKCMSKKGVDVNKAIPFAVTNSDEALANKILEKEGDANKLLGEAVKQNNSGMMQMALETGSTSPDKHIQSVITAGNSEIVSMMFDYGANPDKALDFAVRADKKDIIKLALETGSTTPTKHLKMMVDKGYTDLAKSMVDFGADPSKGMQSAIDKVSKELVEYFITNGADPTPPGYLNTAAGTDFSIAELLVQSGADPNNGIKTAAINNKSQIVGMLLDNGATPDLGLKPALEKNHTESAKLIIEAGATPTEVIGIPAGFGNDAIVTLLLDAGANPQNGMATACRSGQVSTVKTLIEYGADGNNQDYMTAAVAGLHAGLIPLLFEQGINPNGRYPDGGTFIHKAASMPGCLNTVAALIAGGVDATAPDNQGNTALHTAVRQGKENAPVVTALVDAGIDVNALNNKGETPLKVAKNAKTKKALKNLGGVRKVKN